MKKYAKNIKRGLSYILVACLISSCTLVQIKAGVPGKTDREIIYVSDIEPVVNIERVEEPEVEPEVDIFVEPVVEVVEKLPEPVVEPEKTYYDIPLSKELQDHIFKICEERDVDPAIVIGVIERESDFRPGRMGDSGKSYGLMQVMKKWHVKRMEKLGVTDLSEPFQNVLVGIDYLDELIDRGNGIEWALMAYNGGPSYANKKAAAGIVTKYAVGVMEYARNLQRVL